MPTDIAELIALMPLAEHLGIKLAEASPERVVGTLDWAEHLCTANGVMHGGALMSLADSVVALVAYLNLEPGQTTATITSTTNMYRPVTGGTVRAVAEALHKGRTTISAQASLFDGDNRLVASVSQVQAVRSPAEAPK